MLFKVLIIIGIIAVIQGIIVDSKFRIDGHQDQDNGKQLQDYDPNPQYIYGYEIEDEITGDSKMQREVREGNVVKGSYSFVEPDGMRRIVEYTVDPVRGFNALIRREPVNKKT